MGAPWLATTVHLGAASHGSVSACPGGSHTGPAHSNTRWGHMCPPHCTNVPHQQHWVHRVNIMRCVSLWCGYKYSTDQDKYSTDQDKYSTDQDKYSTDQDKYSTDHDKYSTVQVIIEWPRAFQQKQFTLTLYRLPKFKGLYGKVITESAYWYPRLLRTLRITPEVSVTLIVLPNTPRSLSVTWPSPEPISKTTVTWGEGREKGRRRWRCCRENTNIFPLSSNLE